MKVRPQTSGRPRRREGRGHADEEKNAFLVDFAVFFAIFSHIFAFLLVLSPFSIIFRLFRGFPSPSEPAVRHRPDGTRICKISQKCIGFHRFSTSFRIFPRFPAVFRVCGILKGRGTPAPGFRSRSSAPA
jgi:hypothetical protein